MPAYDVMPDIELFQPLSVEDAAELAGRLGKKGWLLAGGQDTFGWLKDRAKSPEAMIDLKGIDTLKGIRETANGIEIGALTTITEIANDAMIRERFGLLSRAAAHVASPQIRNMGTLGGNLCQDTRCWYYRRGLSCYRAGGNVCYAGTPDSMNREHAVFGASRCVAVTPSDTAPALVALDATMIATSTSGSREIRAADFFVGPDVDIKNMTTLNPGEILVSVRIPNTWANAAFYFEKVSDRNVWDFALVSIATAMKVEGGVIKDARLVCGGVECVPHRLTAVENRVIGMPKNDATGDAVADLASLGAEPLAQNEFKMPMMENLVRRALRA
jgi:xanthine dehydrogenase YagS FAD-binding subunit